jgi:hypothetical protein
MKNKKFFLSFIDFSLCTLYTTSAAQSSTPNTKVPLTMELTTMEQFPAAHRGGTGNGMGVQAPAETQRPEAAPAAEPRQINKSPGDRGTSFVLFFFSANLLFENMESNINR